MKVNQDHWNAFLDFAEEYPGLLTNKFSGASGRARARAMWHRVTEQLNSLGYGTKTIEEWRKAVTDWKCKVKAKAVKINKVASTTGGGAVNYPPLTNAEERLLKIIGTKGIKGDNIPDLGISQVASLQILSNSSDHCLTTASSEPQHIFSQSQERNTDITLFEDDEIESSPMPSTSAFVETSVPPDHQYTNRKPSIVKKRKHSTLLEGRLGVSDKLLKLNEESLYVIKSIDNKLDTLNATLSNLASGINSIAQSMKVLAEKK